MTSSSRVAIVVLLVACSACGEDFAPFNRLTDVRVLAMQSEPVVPQSGETSTLSALVYAPESTPVTGYRWSWCPFPGPANDGYPCLVTEEELRQMAGGLADTIPPFNLGEDETALFEHSMPAELLAGICSGQGGGPALPDCSGGLAVQLKLDVLSGSRSFTAVRTFRLGFEAGHSHQNPSAAGLWAEVSGSEVAVPDDGSVTIPRDQATMLRADVPEASAESYELVDDQGQPVAQRERLLLTWFIESGDTDDERTGFIDGAVPLEDALTNEWTPAKTEDYPDDSSRLIVVVRDDREGVTWLEGRVTLEEQP